MSKQEMTSGESAPVVVVEQTPSSRHKPYRPTEMQQDGSPELHKRSKAPAVPSVTEDIKDTIVAIAKDTGNTKERVEGDRALSAERQSHHAKKSPSKRRGSSPEDIALELIDTQKENITTTTPQPIPDTDTIVSEGKKDEKIDKENKADENSITGEIAEVRTAESAKDHSGWVDQPTNSNAAKKKEITWEDSDYLNNVNLQNEGEKSQAALLERTASVGPCFKPKMLYGGPSGIFVCVPKKSVRSMKEDSNPVIQSVINFNIPKKLESNSAPHVEARYQKWIHKKATPKKLEKELKIEAHPKFFEVLREKIDNMTSKIRNLLNM